MKKPETKKIAVFLMLSIIEKRNFLNTCRIYQLDIIP